MVDYATLLRDHVTLTCRSIDRLFMQAYVPKLQSVGQVCRFLNQQRGYPIPSSAAFGEIGRAYARQIESWAQSHGLAIRRFAKGENKEAIAKPLIEAASKEGGEGRVVLIGTAQEKVSAWRSWKAKGQEHVPHPHMEWVGRWLSSITITSTCGIQSGGRRSGRSIAMRPTRSGSGSMVTSGPSAS
jgi:hypothetical protein